MTSRLAGALAGLVLATGLALPTALLAQDLQFGLPPVEDVPYDIEDVPYDGMPTEEAPADNGSFQELPMEEAPVEVPIERVQNPVAEFSGIDKITGRIISFDVYLNETVQFGALQVTPRICYSSGEGQEPRTDSFVEVDEITLDRKIRRIFSGWMFAESPGLNAVEHAVYDVWLKACKRESDVPAPEAAEG